ncbi:phosphatidylglycerol lysyltransferase domain-containing protein [Pleomorphomonas sp. PLEO]|uniref:phosphatidylglycerol lysyltransferase domain-containing protein n=1 Tax=Pleomorphomonas sp. PLEO TaxID=3239306 RepID=UPI00351DF80F
MQTAEATEVVPTASFFVRNRSVIFAALALAVAALSLIARRAALGVGLALAAFVAHQLTRPPKGYAKPAAPDDIARVAARSELVGRFVELVREHRGRAVFYQVAARKISLYADLGLSAFKLGENAIVDLSVSDIKGSRRSSLRNGLNPLLTLADLTFVIGGGLRGVVAK